MFFNNYKNFLIDFENYTTSLVYLNILMYIFLIINIFFILFLFDLKYLKTLNELKFLGNNYYVTFYLILIFLSFAGTPPLLGFLGKFFIFNFLILKKNFFIFLIFILLNFFSMYFYLQNLRFLISKKTYNMFFKKQVNIIYIFNIFNFLNVFSIFYFEDCFISLIYFFSFVNF